MREQTGLQHTYQFVGREWNPITGKGNFDKSRATIDMIIIHSMAGSMAGTLAHFQNPNTIPSATYGIGLNGEIVQYLPENATAYHSGNYSVNQRSLGIEHEDQGNNQMTRSEALYNSSIKLVADIAKFYGIPLDREHVRKHNEVPDPKTGKGVATSCPGNLDIDRIINGAKQLLSQPQEEALHSYDMKPSVFSSMVTKATEYDEIWAVLGLPPELKANPGSHKLIQDYFQSKLSEARSSVNPVTPTQPLLPTPAPQTSPSNQAVSVWRTDVIDILKSILGALRGNRAS